MSIYLDGMFYRCSGVGRVYENLLTAFAAEPDVGEIHTIVPALHKERFLEQFPHPMIVPTFVGYGPMGFGDLARKAVLLRSLREKVRLYFFPGHNVPLSVPGRYIVSVNDVTVFSPHFRLPWYRKAGFRRLLSRAVHGAEAVVTISETVEGDLVREFGLPPGKDPRDLPVDQGDLLRTRSGRRDRRFPGSISSTWVYGSPTRTSKGSSAHFSCCWTIFRS